MRCYNVFCSIDISLTLLAIAVLTLSNPKAVAGQLKVGFYDSSCPRAESAISAAVGAASSLDSGLPPKLLRLLFHDCFVDGCDGSILIDSTANNSAEKSDPANLTVGGFSLIETIKSTLEVLCGGIVSCADIVALAARDAVMLMGGPSVQIPTGRRDGVVSLASHVSSNIPDTTFSVDQLTAFFNAKGLSQEELVVLSGSHTIGVAHCSAFSDRFTFSSNGSATASDPTLDPTFAQVLLAQCPSNANPTTVISNDQITPSSFDNAYYLDLQRGRGLFHSDEALFTDGRTKGLVNTFASNQGSFFTSWVSSFTKLSTIGVKTGSEGEIRKSCSAVNAS